MVPLLDATDLHRVRRRMYRAGPVRLWYPVAGAQAILTVAALFVTRWFYGLLDVGLSARSAVFFFAPAAGIFAVAARDTVEGRSLGDSAIARLRWALYPTALVVS